MAKVISPHIENRKQILEFLKEELVGPSPQGKPIDCTGEIHFDDVAHSYGPWHQMGSGEEVVRANKANEARWCEDGAEQVTKFIAGHHRSYQSSISRHKNRASLTFTVDSYLDQLQRFVLDETTFLGCELLP